MGSSSSKSERVLVPRYNWYLLRCVYRSSRLLGCTNKRALASSYEGHKGIVEDALASRYYSLFLLPRRNHERISSRVLVAFASELPASTGSRSRTNVFSICNLRASLKNQEQSEIRAFRYFQLGETVPPASPHETFRRRFEPHFFALLRRKPTPAPLHWRNCRGRGNNRSGIAKLFCIPVVFVRAVCQRIRFAFDPGLATGPAPSPLSKLLRAGCLVSCAGFSPC